MESKNHKVESQIQGIQQLQLQLEIGKENLLHEQSEVKVAMDLTKEWVKIQNFDEEEPQ